jgi:hypothetical protein
MRIMSLQAFMQQASEPQEVLAMSVREFLNAIATQCEDTCTAVVTLDAPEPNSISVKFFQPGVEKAETGALTENQPENLSPTFELSVVRVGDGLPDLRDYATVDVTLDKHDPTKVLLKFRKDEESGE